MDLGSVLPPRSIEDILAERIVLTLGGVRYVLPVKPMRGQREWEEELDRSLVRLLYTARDDGDDVDAILRALSESAWPFIDLLLSYDEGSVLPDRDTIADTTTEWGLFLACMEVWRAGHPKAELGIDLLTIHGLRSSAFPELTSSLWPSGVSVPESLRTS